MGERKFASPNLSNLKDGRAMATRKLTADDLQGIRQFAKQWGKIIVRRTYGEQGPDLDVDLTQMEEMAFAAAQGLTAGALEEATEQQGQRLGSEKACPTCGRLCSIGTEERRIDVKGGAFQLREPKGYCPACRRDFFPSTSAAEAGDARLQCDHPAQDPVRNGPGEIA
jgi:hypothetical protein